MTDRKKYPKDGTEGQCRATSKSTGERCKGRPIVGGNVCWYHGGASPRAQNAAKDRIAEKEALKILATSLEDAKPMTSVGDVYQELLELMGVNKAWREMLQQRVAQLSSYGTDTLMGEQVRVDVALFERAIARSAKMGEAIARLNLEERRLRLDENMAGLLATTIQWILRDLELTPEQRKAAKEIVPARIRDVEMVS